MAILYRNSAGVDFDDLFDPYKQGTANLTGGGYKDSGGGDIGNRYAPISFGSKGPNVSYMLTNGADVSTLWAAIGTAQYALAINGTNWSRGYSAPTNSSGTKTVTFTFSLLSNGNYQLTSGTTDAGSRTDTSGTWNTFGFATDVRIILTNIAGDSVGGPQDTGYVAIGSGRGLSASVNIQANTADEKNGDGRYRVIITRAGQGDAGIVSDSTFTVNLSAVGWL